MKNFLLKVVAVLALLTMVGLSSVAHAAIYYTQRITHIYADAGGRVLIKWEGSPSPGPCGTNNGWVTIPASADKALKALAIAIYFSGEAARIDTSGCDGRNEAVSSLYSPNG